jgi:hypothetical protein
MSGGRYCQGGDFQVVRAWIANYIPSRSGDANREQPRRLDLWRTREPNLKNDDHAERCLSLGSVLGVSAAFVNSVPTGERGSDQPLTLTADNRSLRVEFHDLDTPMGVASSTSTPLLCRT